MALKNARGNRLYYNYASRHTTWPVWERRQKWLGYGLVVGAILILAGIIIFFALAQ